MPVKVSSKAGAKKPATRKTTTTAAAKPASGGRAKKEPVTLTHSLEKETPGSVRFAQDVEDKADALAPTIYLRKDNLAKAFGKTPKGIEVTITPVF